MTDAKDYAGQPREVLLFASYCGGDNPECSDARPCPVCLGMSNVFRIPAGTKLDYVRQLAPEWNGVEALSNPAAIADLTARLAEAEKRALEAQMLAFKWMVAHDSRKAGVPYDYPKPADLPDAIARATAVEATLATAVEVMKPFGAVAERIATNHPGWDHDDFMLKIGSEPSKLGPYRRARDFIRDHGGVK